MPETREPAAGAEEPTPEAIERPAPSRRSRRRRGADKDEAPPAKDLGPLGMIWRETRKYPRQLSIAIFALFLASAGQLAIPWRLKDVIDRAYGDGANVDVINHSFRYLAMIVLVIGFASALRFYFVSWLGERVVADVRLKVQQNLLRLAPGFFEENSPKEISSRMTSDTAIIEQVVGTTVSVALRNGITGLGGVILLMFIDWRLTAMLVIGALLVVMTILLLGRRLRMISRESQDRVAEIGAKVTEVLGAMKIVQSFNQEQRESSRFAEAVEGTFDTAKRRILLRAGMTATFITLVFGSITALMWRGALGVATGAITGGTIAAFLVVGVMVAGAFAALAEVYSDLLRGAGAASRLSELLNEKPAIAPPARPVDLPTPARGSLAFQNVTFRYPTRPEVAAISDFTLVVEPGETVAVVGPSGAGKSTIFQLAERFYDPQAGALKLDGVPMTSADPAAIRERIAYVPQEGVLFAANARDNLRYGKWDATDEEIWEAAQAANAEQFLRDLPQGLDTFLGEGGARLSGGQRQRVAIARALLRDAPILLLDEATSALDAESERLVQDALEHLMQNRTTLVIAHRLATIRSADRIVVMEGGRIVEQGNHAELASAGGLYARLASLQFTDVEKV